MEGLKAFCLLQGLGFVIVPSTFSSTLDIILHHEFFFLIEDNERMYQPSFHYYHKCINKRGLFRL